MKKVHIDEAAMELLRLKHALDDREAALQQKQEESAVNHARYSRGSDPQ